MALVSPAFRHGIARHGFCFNRRDRTIFRLKPTETFGLKSSVLILEKQVTLPPCSSNVFFVENGENNLACASMDGSGDPPRAKSNADQAVGTDRNGQRIKTELREAHRNNLVENTDVRANAHKKTDGYEQRIKTELREAHCNNFVEKSDVRANEHKKNG